MKSLSLNSTIILCCFIFPIFAMTPADKDEYERLGLSQIEWEMIQKAKMPKSKVYELLKCGVSIKEYFASPWMEFGMSEDEWLSRRRAGESSSDIRLKEQRRTAEAHRVSKGEWDMIQGFFLPGLHQFLRAEPVRGYFMSGIAVLSIGYFVYQTTSSKTFQPLGLFFLLPDMVWSGVDIGIQIQKEQNPDASRFTQSRGFSQRVALTVTVPLQR